VGIFIESEDHRTDRLQNKENHLVTVWSINFDGDSSNKFEVEQMSYNFHTSTAIPNDYGRREHCAIDAFLREPGLVRDDGTITATINLFQIRDHLWHESNDYDSRKAVGLVGIKNQGATCYMNALLQVFFHLRGFRRAVYRASLPSPSDVDGDGHGNGDVNGGVNGDGKGEDANDPSETKKLKGNDGTPRSRSSTPKPAAPPLCFALAKTFHCLHKSKSPISTKDLTRSFGWDSRDAFVQHDVQELSRVLLEKVEDRFEKTGEKGNVQELFEGEAISFIKCKEVDYASERREKFMDVQVDVSGCKNLTESLDKYIEKEMLDGDNQYDASDGGFGKQDAEKGIIFSKLPKVLNIHLKRFEFNLHKMSMVKVNDKFDFPFDLDMSKYVVNSSGKSSDADMTSDDTSVDVLRQHYKLHSILLHAGDVNAGHYYCYVQPDMLEEKKWYKMDDENVRDVTGDEMMVDAAGDGVSRCSAYMLVYVREQDLEEIMGDVKNVPSTKAEIGPLVDSDIPYEFTELLAEQEKLKAEDKLSSALAKNKVCIHVITDEHLQRFDRIPTHARNLGYRAVFNNFGARNNFHLLEVDKMQPLLHLFKAICERLNLPTGNVRLWSIAGDGSINEHISPERLRKDLVASLFDKAVYVEVVSDHHLRREQEGTDVVIARPVTSTLGATDNLSADKADSNENENNDDQLLQSIPTTSRTLVLVKQFHQHSNCGDKYCYENDDDNNNPPLHFIGTLLFDQERATFEDIQKAAKFLTTLRVDHRNEFTKTDMEDMKLEECTLSHLFVSTRKQGKLVTINSEMSKEVAEDLQTGSLTVIQAASQTVFEGWVLEKPIDPPTLVSVWLKRVGDNCRGKMPPSRNLRFHRKFLRGMIIYEIIPVDFETASLLADPLKKIRIPLGNEPSHAPAEPSVPQLLKIICRKYMKDDSEVNPAQLVLCGLLDTDQQASVIETDKTMSAFKIPKEKVVNYARICQRLREEEGAGEEVAQSGENRPPYLPYREFGTQTDNNAVLLGIPPWDTEEGEFVQKYYLRVLPYGADTLLGKGNYMGVEYRSINGDVAAIIGGSDRPQCSWINMSETIIRAVRPQSVSQTCQLAKDIIDDLCSRDLRCDAETLLRRLRIMSVKRGRVKKVWESGAMSISEISRASFTKMNEKATFPRFVPADDSDCDAKEGVGPRFNLEACQPGFSSVERLVVDLMSKDEIKLCEELDREDNLAGRRPRSVPVEVVFVNRDSEGKIDYVGVPVLTYLRKNEGVAEVRRRVYQQIARKDRQISEDKVKHPLIDTKWSCCIVTAARDMRVITNGENDDIVPVGGDKEKLDSISDNAGIWDDDDDNDMGEGGGTSDLWKELRSLAPSKNNFNRGAEARANSHLGRRGWINGGECGFSNGSAKSQEHMGIPCLGFIVPSSAVNEMVQCLGGSYVGSGSVESVRTAFNLSTGKMKEEVVVAGTSAGYLGMGGKCGALKRKSAALKIENVG